MRGYLRHLRIDQHTGRWTQEDPLGVAGGLNLYQFNGNDPVTFTDPFGLCPPAWMCQLITNFVVNHPRVAEAVSTLIDQEAAGFACGAQAFHNCQVPPSGTAGALAGQLTLALSVRAPIGGATTAGAEASAASTRCGVHPLSRRGSVLGDHAASALTRS